MLKITYQNPARTDNITPRIAEDSNHVLVVPAFEINKHKVPETRIDLDKSNGTVARIFVSTETGAVTLNEGWDGWLILMSKKLPKSGYTFNYETFDCEYQPADCSNTEWYSVQLPEPGTTFDD